MQNLDQFVNGYKEEEIQEATEQARKLKKAVLNLLENEDFKLIYDHYTKQTVLEEASKAIYAPEHRAQLFESILNRKAFEAYIEELKNIQLD